MEKTRTPRCELEYEFEGKWSMWRPTTRWFSHLLEDSKHEEWADNNGKQRIEGRKKASIKRKNAKRRRQWFESNKMFTF
jgi:hypothetical protein